MEILARGHCASPPLDSEVTLPGVVYTGAWSCPVSADLPCICRGPLRTERRARLSALSVLGAPKRAHAA